MRVLVLGNQGYVGPVVTQHLHQRNVGVIDGLDTSYFAHCICTNERVPEFGLSTQFFKDVRDVTAEDLQGYDALVYLAAISNDPMGKEFEQSTLEINQEAALQIAKQGLSQGVKHFVFASSCSVYGAAEGKRNEKSELNPLTAYARSKINSEKNLYSLASPKFRITCLRFATACGWSPRLRLDLVLNDFVASAVANQRIDILSDGTPWRPLIHVQDMARAIEWALLRDTGSEFLAINVGTDQWNYQVQELAEVVVRVIPETTVQVNQDAPPDNRSYQVDFSLYKDLAPHHQPKVSLEEAVKGLREGFKIWNFQDSQFRSSKHVIRLNTLRDHQEHKRLDDQLRWKI